MLKIVQRDTAPLMLAIRIFREDRWLEAIGPGTVLDIEARAPGTTHAISLRQVERWLAWATETE